MYTKPTEPLSIGGVLDDGFKLTREAYTRLFFISLVGAVLSNLPTALMGNPTDPMDIDLVGFYLSFAVSMPISMFVFAVALLRANRIANDEDASLGELINIALRRFVPLIVVTVLYMIILFVGLLLLLIPGIWLATALVFATYLVVIDETGIIESLKRSMELVRGNWWRTTTILLVLMFVLTVLFTAVGIAAGFFAGQSGDMSSVYAVNLIVTPLLTALYMPVLYCGTLAILSDLRLRLDGEDLENRLAGVENN